jgi:hypothetical protein
MIFTRELSIERPRRRVLELMMDPANTPQWQSGIQRIEPLSSPGDVPGARSRVVLAVHGIRLDMIETVVRRSPPDLFVSAFESRGVKNLVTNRFLEEGPARTRWVMENSFEFPVLMSPLVGLIRDVMSRQTLEAMQRFKRFAESD